MKRSNDWSWFWVCLAAITVGLFLRTLGFGS